MLERLGLRRSRGTAGTDDWSPGAVARHVEGLDPERSRLMGAFAAVLVRAARADLQVSGDETERIVKIVRELGGLSEEDARLAVDLAVEAGAARGSTHDYLATRELKRLAGPADRERLLHCLFAVCAADDSISIAEEEEVRQMASELGFEHREYTAARAAFRDKREVLRGMPRRP